MSYYHQIRELLSIEEVNSILEIGPGTPLLKEIVVFNKPNILYRTVDIAQDVQPDIIGEVVNIPVSNESVDVVCAFQVLEHVPFDQFEDALKEMARVAKRYVIISLPHYGPHIRFEFKAPLLPVFRLFHKFSLYKEHTFDGQHHWEIGKKGYELSKIRKIMLNHYSIQKDYIPFENQYHHFFILLKR